MQLLNPYLHFNGQCEEAFTFYAEVLGGEIVVPGGPKGHRQAARRIGLEHGALERRLPVDPVDVR